MSLTYPQILNLDKFEVYHEDDSKNPEYFNIKGLPEILGYGKYWFTISFNDPENKPLIKENSEIIFEVKDEAGLVIYSDVADLNDVNGAAICWLWIKEDPLRTYKEITDGIGTLTIMSVLDDEEIPKELRNKFNLRLTYPIEIRKNITNNHPILFQEDPKVRIQEIIKTDLGDTSESYQRSFVAIETSNLQTYGGKVESVEVLYKNQKIADSKYQQLGTYQLDTPVEMLVGHYDSGSFGEPAGNFAESTFDSVIKNWHMPISASHHISTSMDTSYIGAVTDKWGFGISEPELHGAVRLKPQGISTVTGNQIVKPIMRYVSKVKTQEDINDFILEFTPSGSGAVQVYSIPENLTGSAFTSTIPYDGGVETSKMFQYQFENDYASKYRIYNRGFLLYDPSASLSEGTEVDGKQTWKGERYRIRQNLSLPKDRYFVIDIESSTRVDLTGLGDLSPQFLIKNISFKLQPQKGTNPNYYTSKLELPTTRRDQNLDFQVRFLNPKNEYSQYVNSGSTDVVTEATKSFQGAPLIIEKADNLLTGDILIGSSKTKGEVFGKLGYEVYRDASTPSSSNKGFGYVTLTRDDQQGFGDKIILDESGSRSRIIISGSSLISSSQSTSTTSYEPETGIILYHTGSDGVKRSSMTAGYLQVDGDISASGAIIANTYKVVNTVISQSVIFSSGSTAFGDTQDDTHTFKGNLIISASSISGSSNTIAEFNRLDISNHGTPGILFTSKTDEGTTAGQYQIGLIDDSGASSGYGTALRIGRTGLGPGTVAQFFLKGTDINSAGVVVGIGTEKPQEMFHVAGNIQNDGNISSSGDLYIGGLVTSDISASGNIRASSSFFEGNISSSGTGIFNNLEIRGADGTLSADYIIHKDDSNTKFGFPQNDKFKIQTAGTNRYVVDTAHTFTGNIDYSGNISGSATSTGSFGNLVVQGHGSASLFVDGNISGSAYGTGSFGRVICQTISASSGQFDADTVSIGGETINKTLVANLRQTIPDDRVAPLGRTEFDGVISASNVRSAGEIRGEIPHIINSKFYIARFYTNTFFLPMGGSVSEATSDTYQHHFVAPFDGRLDCVLVRTLDNNPTNVTIGLATGSATDHNLSTGVHTITKQLQVKDSTMKFEFSSSLSKFSAGQIVGITYAQSNSVLNSGQATIVFRLNTNRGF